MPQADSGWHLSLRNVLAPTLTPFLPDPATATGTSVIVCPGGGWHLLAVENEGEWVARALAEQGVAAFVLQYRTEPTSAEDLARLRSVRASEDLAYLSQIEPPARARGAEDGAAAVRHLRENAEHYQIDPHRIGMLGFSAGGHLALATTALGPADARPDWIAPIYPVAWPGFEPPDSPPPVFLAFASDDDLGPVLMESVRTIYRGWLDAGAPAEIHAYERGGHGFGFEQQGAPSDRWFAELLRWMQGRGLLP